MGDSNCIVLAFRLDFGGGIHPIDEQKCIVGEASSYTTSFNHPGSVPAAVC